MTWTACALLLPLFDPRPPASDIHRFPPLPIIIEQLAANREHAVYLQSRQQVELDRAWQLQLALDETHRRWWAWDWLRVAAAGGAGGNGQCCRTSLRELRECIGFAAYLSGRMPAALPY